MSVSGHFLFVSARITVSIFTYPGSQHVSYSVFECIPVRICTYPVSICTYPVSYLLVHCLRLHLQFNAHSAKHQPSRPAKLPHTHTHSLCRVLTKGKSPCPSRHCSAVDRGRAEQTAGQQFMAEPDFCTGQNVVFPFPSAKEERYRTL